MTGRIFGTRLMATLTTLFNALALNLAMIVASLPVITAPAAVSAASATLDRWAGDGEDRVIRQFIAEFRARWSARLTVGVGVPLGAVVLGGAEVRHFAREATLTGRAGLCLACGALLITLGALGYLFQLSADQPGLAPVDLWSRAARLAVRNLPVAGLLSAVPAVGLALLAARDPAVLLLGLPLFLLHALKLLARPGLAAGRARGLVFETARYSTPPRTRGAPPMPDRQFPKPDEIFELMRFKKPELDARKRRLASALTIYDLREIAKRRTPRAAFDYTDGAAESEVSLRRARQAFEDVEFHPSILRDVSALDTSTSVFGGPSALPFGIAPTGFTRLMQTEGETAGAGAAGAAGIPFSLSTLGTTSIEDVKAANPNGRNWFQLYVMRDREVSYDLVRRAAAAGFDTLFFTVDAPVAGARLRDKRNGFSIPPQITLGTVINAIPRPWWWYDFLTTPKLEFASLTATGGTVGELLDAAMDPTISFKDLDVIRGLWPGKLVVKGVQQVEDCRTLADLGVDGIVLSNHGGRQLDRAPVPFHLLPEVVKAVGGRTEIAIDTGIMNGADVVASIAMGAQFTLVGRAYLYGLMAGGRAGVDRAIEILRGQVIRTMKLLGVASVAELNPGHVTQLRRLGPIREGGG